MNIIWSVLFVLSLIFLLIKDVSLAFSSILAGSEKALMLAIKLFAIYCVWLGLLKIVEDTKLDKKISKLISPVIKFLFGKVDDKTKQALSINLTSNLLGMGNASTPSGIEAMTRLSNGQKHITSGMIMLLVLNTSNLQIIPTTIISLRALHGSSLASGIILPTIVTSICSVAIGVILVKLLNKIFRTR